MSQFCADAAPEKNNIASAGRSLTKLMYLSPLFSQGQRKPGPNRPHYRWTIKSIRVLSRCEFIPAKDSIQCQWTIQNAGRAGKEGFRSSAYGRSHRFLT